MLYPSKLHGYVHGVSSSQAYLKGTFTSSKIQVQHVAAGFTQLSSVTEMILPYPWWMIMTTGPTMAWQEIIFIWCFQAILVFSDELYSHLIKSWRKTRRRLEQQQQQNPSKISSSRNINVRIWNLESTVIEGALYLVQQDSLLVFHIHLYICGWKILLYL